MIALRLIVVVLAIALVVVFANQDHRVTSFFTQDIVVAAIHIEPEYLNVLPGEQIISEVTLYQTDGREREDVRVITSVFSEDGEVVYNSEQTIALETSLSFVSRFSLPEDAKAGSYELVIQIFDNENENLQGKASQRFFVDSGLRLSPLNNNRWLIWIIAGLFAIVVTLFLVILLKNSKSK